MIEEIKGAVQGAAEANRKSAMFHYQVLKNADQLVGVDPIGFCKEIGMPVTYATEFRKMMALARLMREQGTRLTGG